MAVRRAHNTILTSVNAHFNQATDLARQGFLVHGTDAYFEDLSKPYNTFGLRRLEGESGDAKQCADLVMWLVSESDEKVLVKSDARALYTHRRLV